MRFSPTVAAERVSAAALWAVGLSPAVFSVFVWERVPDTEGVPVDWGSAAPQAATAPWRIDVGLAYASVTIGLLVATLVLAVADNRRTPRSHVGGPLAAAAVGVYLGPLLSAAAGGHGGVADWRLWLGPLCVAAVYASPALTLETLLRRLRVILRVYTWGSLCALVVAPDWALTPNDIVNFRLPWVGAARLVGLTDHPIPLGVMAAAVLALELAPLVRSRLWTLHAAAAAAVLLLAQSRTAWIAALVGLPLIYRHTSARRVPPLLVRGLIAGMACCAGALVPTVAMRFTKVLSSPEVVSLHGRTTVWDLAMSAFRADPLFGYGPTLFTDPSSPVHGTYAHAHSQIYQTLSTSGLVGAVGLLLFAVALLAAASRTGAVSAGLTWSLVGITLVTCMAEAPLRSDEFSPFLLLVVVDIAVLLAAERAAAAVEPAAQPVVPAAGYGRSARSAANNWPAAGSSNTSRLGSAG